MRKTSKQTRTALEDFFWSLFLMFVLAGMVFMGLECSKMESHKCIKFDSNGHCSAREGWPEK